MKRGEIWTANLEPRQGEEIGKNRRPVVVVSRDELNHLYTRVVVPFSTWQDKFTRWGWVIRVDATPENGLQCPSGLMTVHIRSVSTGRLVERLGVLDEQSVEALELTLRGILNL